MALPDHINDREYRRFDEDNSVRVRTDEVKQIKTEVVNSQLTYEGRAISMNALTSEAVWQIKRVTVSGSTTTTLFADDGNYTQVWDDRNTLFTPSGFFNQLSTDFDGINDYIDFGDVYEYTAAEAFSISIWIKPQNFAATRIFVGKVTNDTNVYGWRLGLNTSGNITSQMRGPAQAHAGESWPSVLVADTWTHVVWTYSGSGNKSGQSLYINGVKESFTPASGSITNMAASPYPLTIGRAPANHYVGNLDEFAVWDKELTQADVNEIYNSGVPASLTSLLVSGDLESWWRLGDSDTYPTVLDQQGVANGTMTNMTSGDFEADVP